jgi:hypothetical protein
MTEHKQRDPPTTDQPVHVAARMNPPTGLDESRTAAAGVVTGPITISPSRGGEGDLRSCDIRLTTAGFTPL